MTRPLAPSNGPSARPYHEALAEELRALAARKRIHGTELARAMGVSQSWVSRRMQGSSAMAVSDVEMFAAALGVPLRELLERAADSACNRFRLAAAA